MLLFLFCLKQYNVFVFVVECPLFGRVRVVAFVVFLLLLLFETKLRVWLLFVFCLKQCNVFWLLLIVPFLDVCVFLLCFGIVFLFETKLRVRVFLFVLCISFV